MQSQEQELVAERPVKWHFVHSLAFRIALSYFVLYFLPKPPSFWIPATLWVGQNLLHTASDFQVQFNGSGDTTYHYILAVCNLLLALVAGLVWSACDPKRPNYQKLELWLKLCLRLVLGSTMLSYGSSKVFEGQFPQPGLTRLVEPFGDASPMGLLWTFMGASRAYTFFAGLAEVVPGLLLFFPPLAGAGALLCAVVMFNVFMLNLCYDVPVKLYSFHLLITALYLAYPYLCRVIAFLVFNRAVAPLPATPLFKRGTANDIALALQVFLGVVVAAVSLIGGYQREKHPGCGGNAATTPMYGIWQVDECTFAPDEKTDSADILLRDGPWHKVIFDHPGYVTVQLLKGTSKHYLVSVEGLNHKIILSSAKDPTWQRVMSTVEVTPDIVTMDSKGEGVPAHIKMHKIDASKFLLKSRGFHWINEYPCNQ